ncbi:MAG: hypothetical protein GY863_18655, partial [bacterium]|nr:hypothetical protein [bacterium]
MDKILNEPRILSLAAAFLTLSILNIVLLVSRKRSKLKSYFGYIWYFFLIFMVGEVFSFYIAAWLWGFLCFFILREFFSLIDFRLQDRFGIVGAYFSVPFMMHFIHTDWYNMFIITIPVYSFLIIPFLVAVGGKDQEGAINSIGIIDFGLFLFVYCIGHLAYLSYYSIWMAAMLIINVVIYDILAMIVEAKTEGFWKRAVFTYVLSVPVIIFVIVLVSDWCMLPMFHAVSLGLIIPAVIIIGNFTIKYIESDLG